MPDGSCVLPLTIPTTVPSTPSAPLLHCRKRPRRGHGGPVSCASATATATPPPQCVVVTPALSLLRPPGGGGHAPPPDRPAPRARAVGFRAPAAAAVRRAPRCVSPSALGGGRGGRRRRAASGGGGPGGGAVVVGRHGGAGESDTSCGPTRLVRPAPPPAGEWDGAGRWSPRNRRGRGVPRLPATVAPRANSRFRMMDGSLPSLPLHTTWVGRGRA